MSVYATLYLLRDERKITLGINYFVSLMDMPKRREIFKRSGLDGFEYAVGLHGPFTEYERLEIKKQITSLGYDVEVEIDRSKQLTIIVKA